VRRSGRHSLIVTQAYLVHLQRLAATRQRRMHRHSISLVVTNATTQAYHHRVSLSVVAIKPQRRCSLAAPRLPLPTRSTKFFFLTALRCRYNAAAKAQSRTPRVVRNNAADTGTPVYQKGSPLQGRGGGTHRSNPRHRYKAAGTGTGTRSPTSIR
jgi:hypothetical protein